MRVLIDIPEQDYELACNYPTVLFGSYAQFIKKGTIIPDNATNGDMVKAMFPNATFMIGEEKDEQGTKNLYVYTDDFEGFAVDLDWWNSPYKKEVE